MTSYSDYGKQAGKSMRRHMRRQVLCLLEEETEETKEMHWREKIKLIDKLTRGSPIFVL